MNTEETQNIPRMEINGLEVAKAENWEELFEQNQDSIHNILSDSPRLAPALTCPVCNSHGHIVSVAITDDDGEDNVASFEFGKGRWAGDVLPHSESSTWNVGRVVYVMIDCLQGHRYSINLHDGIIDTRATLDVTVWKV